MSDIGNRLGQALQARPKQVTSAFTAVWPPTRKPGPTPVDYQALDLARQQAIGNAIDEAILQELAAAGGASPPVTVVCAVPVKAGMPVYVDRSTFQLRPASAAVGFQAFVAGFAAADGATGVAIPILRDKVIMLAWDMIAGAPALQPGQSYYLGSAAGQITLVPPSASGQSLVPLGTALSSTTLVVDIGQPILL
jgi:hypothetical protein